MPKTVTRPAAPDTTSPTSLLEDAPLFAGLDDFVLPQRRTASNTAPKTAASRKKAAPSPQPKQQPATKRVRSQRTIPKTSPMDEALLLSVAEMCRLLNISRATLLRMDKAGNLPGKIKLGGSVRFHRKTVEAWLHSLLTPPKLSP